MKHEYNRHHVPPRRPDKKIRFLKRVRVSHHQAYHLLFGNPPDFETACRILWHDWFSPDTKVMEIPNGDQPSLPSLQRALSA